MRLTHCLLHLLRISVHNQRGSLCQREELPSFLEDMGKGEEVQHTVFLAYRHTFVVGLEGSMILSHRQDDTLGVARRATGIEDIGNIIERGTLLQHLDLRLARVVLAHLQKVVEIDGIGIVLSDTYVLVEDDDALQRLTHADDPMRLVVLFLFAYKEEANLRIGDHKLYLLFRTRGIEGDGDSTDAPCAKVAEEILDGILGEDTDILLHLHPEI